MSGESHVLEKMDAVAERQPQHGVSPLFAQRWSPRAMSGESLQEEELLPLFEAARWAPSSYNNQPWRFLYAPRDSEDWQRFLDLLVDFNRKWAEKAGCLLVIVSKKTFDRNGKPSRTHSFDTGAAWQNLALQASLNGLVTHGMEGFDYERTRQLLEVPEDYEVEAMVAIGKPAPVEELPEKLQEREKPSPRKELTEIAWTGPFRQHS